MSPLFFARLLLDFVAVSLLLTAYAYNWLGNAGHEVIGTALFALLVLHNFFNRRWYAAIARRRSGRSTFAKVLTLSLLVTMLCLAITSVIISQTVFSILPLVSSFTARQAHTLAAYGVLLIVALHIGLQWSAIMDVVRRKLGIKTSSTVRVFVIRWSAISIAACGVYSLWTLNIVSKLSMQLPSGFSDFQHPTPTFLLHHLAIIGLGIWVVHNMKRIMPNLT